MKQEVKELLVQYQQGELDGVLVYQALAKLSPAESMKKALLELAADEGRHAGILKKYTNKILTPNNESAKMMEEMYKQYGNKIFERIAEAEEKGEKMYAPFINDIPEAKSMIEDELKHAKIARSFLD